MSRAMCRRCLAFPFLALALILHGCNEKSWDPNAGIIVTNGTDDSATCNKRQEKCKCPDDYSVVGTDAACGDGSSQHFVPADIEGKDCECKQNLGCPEVTTEPNFDLDQYISKVWYVQQQMAVDYLPVEWNFCVTAQYEPKTGIQLNGYDLKVNNYAYESDGTEHASGDGFLNAYAYDRNDAAKLAVAPWFVPKWFSGEYWVLAYNEAEGYALISGGQPKVATPTGCRSGTKTNGSGLWIFTREAQPDPAIVEKVRGIAQSKGFDLTVLRVVDHDNCEGRKNYPPASDRRLSERGDPSVHV